MNPDVKPAPQALVEADQLLIDHAKTHGYSVQSRQLKRFRTEGLLPHRAVHSRGRAGTESRDAYHAEAQLVALLGYHASYPRSYAKVTLSLWYDGWDIDPEHVRRIVAGTYAKMKHQAARRALKIAAGRAQASDDARPVDALDIAEAQADTALCGLSSLEKKLIADIGDTFTDNVGERVPATRVVKSARIDLAAAMLTPADQEPSADTELVSRYLRMDELDRIEGMPAGHAVEVTTPTILRSVQIDRMLYALQRFTHDDLHFIRWFLRQYYDGIETMRAHPGEIDDPLMDYLPLIATTWDTRAPDYGPRDLAFGIATTLMQLLIEKPETLSDPVNLTL